MSTKEGLSAPAFCASRVINVTPGFTICATQGGVEIVQFISLGPILASEDRTGMVVSVGEDPSSCLPSLRDAPEGDGE